MSVSQVGYKIYMSEVRGRVINDIVKKLKMSDVPTSQTITNEINKRWSSLPEYSREHYNRKASK